MRDGVANFPPNVKYYLRIKYRLMNKFIVFLNADIEEISQKAGSFKKFMMFTRMLASAFIKESESVFIDLLTYADLEMLKAKKSGNPNVANLNSSSLNKNHLKRYLILTYQSEFDRVHYPLPLAYEDQPNTESLKRIIRRLRSKNQDKKSHTSQNDSVNKIVTQLRQENTELRHRLRQADSRLKLSTVSQNKSQGPNSINQTQSELALAYGKLKKQYDSTRKEFNDLSITHDRLKNESSKEIARWKAKYFAYYESNSNSTNLPGGANGLGNSDSKEFRRKIIFLEKMLENEKIERKKLITSHRKEILELTRKTSKNSYDQKIRAVSAEKSNQKQSKTKVYSERSISPANSNGRASSTDSKSQSQSRVSRSVSPYLNSRKFDPTDWFNQQQTKRRDSQKRQAWGSSGLSDRLNRESGYSSANSEQVRE